MAHNKAVSTRKDEMHDRQIRQELTLNGQTFVAEEGHTQFIDSIGGAEHGNRETKVFHRR